MVEVHCGTGRGCLAGEDSLSECRMNVKDGWRRRIFLHRFQTKINILNASFLVWTACPELSWMALQDERNKDVTNSPAWIWQKNTHNTTARVTQKIVYYFG